MENSATIIKIGLLVTVAGSILLVKKKGADSFILPGGKPEAGEHDLDTLERETLEELSCNLDRNSIVYVGTFTDQAADTSNTIVEIRLYRGRLLGQPLPSSEIETLKWYLPGAGEHLQLAPSIRNQIVPFLLSSSGKSISRQSYSQ